MTPPKHLRWTAARKAALADKAQTLTAPELAAHFGCTTPAIYQALQRQKISALPAQRKPSGLMQLRDKIQADAQTMSYPELASKYGFNHEVMRAFCKKEGITPVPRRLHSVGRERTPIHLPGTLVDGQRYALKSLPTKATVTWPAHVQVQRIPYLPHTKYQERITNANASGLYTGDELHYRGKTTA